MEAPRGRKSLLIADAETDIREAARARRIETDFMVLGLVPMVSDSDPVTSFNCKDMLRAFYIHSSTPIFSPLRLGCPWLYENLGKFLRRERDASLSAAAHLHSASTHAGSPRANPKPTKHPWVKLGTAWGSLLDKDGFWGIMQVGVRTRCLGSWTGERLISHES